MLTMLFEAGISFLMALLRCALTPRKLAAGVPPKMLVGRQDCLHKMWVGRQDRRHKM